MEKTVRLLLENQLLRYTSTFFAGGFSNLFWAQQRSGKVAFSTPKRSTFDMFFLEPPGFFRDFYWYKNLSFQPNLWWKVHQFCWYENSEGTIGSVVELKPLLCCCCCCMVEPLEPRHHPNLRCLLLLDCIDGCDVEAS